MHPRRFEGCSGGPVQHRCAAEPHARLILQTLIVVSLGLVASACGYYRYAGALEPADPPMPGTAVTADGAASFAADGLEVMVRALSPRELDRQFASRSGVGRQSTNPYTFGRRRVGGGKPERERFTVFHVQVTNSGHARVLVDAAHMTLRTPDGQKLPPLGLEQLQAYYRAYVTGYQGNAYARYQQRIDLLQRTLYENEAVYQGEPAEGHVVFPALPSHVRQVTLAMENVEMGHGDRGEPATAIEIGFQFQRDIGRLYDDGRVVIQDE